MITLADMKAHVRVTHDAEDILILTYLESAQALVNEYLGADSNGPDAKPIDAAIMLLAADLYLNRERQGRDVFNQNQTYQLLLAPYRNLEVQ